MWAVIWIYLSFLLYLFFRSIISIYTKRCSAWLVVQTVEFSVPIWTDMGGLWKLIKPIRRTAWSLWCEGSWKTARNEFVWQTFLEAFIFARLVDKVKKKKESLKTFCILMKKFFWYLFLLLFVILLRVTTYSSTHLHTTKCSCLLCTILSVLLPDA